MTVPAHTLNDGHTIPALGFGTYPLRGDAGRDAMLSALEVGYRMLDTAVNYRNEREVGEALRASGLPRDEVFVTSKLPGRHHGYDAALRSTEASLESLGLDYLDLHLIHWPNPRVGQYHEAWRALSKRRATRTDRCGHRSWLKGRHPPRGAGGHWLGWGP